MTGRVESATAETRTREIENAQASAEMDEREPSEGTETSQHADNSELAPGISTAMGHPKLLS